MRKKRTTVDRQAVIEALKRGEYPEDIAARLGYASITVQKIRQQEGIAFTDRRGRTRGTGKRTIERHHAIREYVSNGHTRAEAAEKFGLSKKTVENICKGLGVTSPRFNKYLMPGVTGKHAREARRKDKIKRGLIDKDITLRKLFERDKGVCWICGMMCDYSDKTPLGNSFIAGNFYPSIDHIIPLCEGGEHSWKNVKLAHKRCNSWRFSSPASQKSQQIA